MSTPREPQPHGDRRPLGNLEQHPDSLESHPQCWPAPLAQFAPATSSPAMPDSGRYNLRPSPEEQHGTAYEKCTMPPFTSHCEILQRTYTPQNLRILAHKRKRMSANAR